MKHGFVKVAAATPQLKLADCNLNMKAVKETMHGAAQQGVKIIAFPELCLCGCTCGDLFRQELLLDRAEKAICSLARETAEVDIVAAVGVPLRIKGMLFNCAAIINKGKIIGIVPQKKFSARDELERGRYFESGSGDVITIELMGEKIPFGRDLIFSCREMNNLNFSVEVGEDFGSTAMPGNIVLGLYSGCQQVGAGEYIRGLACAKSIEKTAAYIRTDSDSFESTTDFVFGAHNIIVENGSVLVENMPFSGEVFAVSEVDVDKIAYERRRNNLIMPNDGKMVEVEFSLAVEETAITRKIERNPFVSDDEKIRNERSEQILNIQMTGLKRRWMHTHAKKIVVGISGGLDSALALLVAVRAADSIGCSRKDILAITMPCFGTTMRTKGNAEMLCEELGVELKHIDIKEAVNKHFEDIGLDPECRDAAYENSQARERTQVLMDTANMYGGFVLGTGDLSELALGWATYNGDHMSMYSVNGGVPKTLVRCLVDYESERIGGKAGEVLKDILDTPVSPELLPAKDGEIAQKTEDLVGPYELHDFYLYYALRWGFSPEKIYRLARCAFEGKYDDDTLVKWIKNFYRRFFTQQFKRSCLPDGPKIGSVGLSPRGDWKMPSDALSAMWIEEAEAL